MLFFFWKYFDYFFDEGVSVVWLHNQYDSLELVFKFKGLF